MTRNTKLLIVVVLTVTVSLTSLILVSTYLQRAAIAQNQNRAQSTVSLSNLTGSIQVFPRLSQTIQSKAHVSLSTAATNAEKSVGPGSHAISARVGIMNGYLIYSVRVIDSHDNLHRIIVDAGNGKVLLSRLPFGNAFFS